MLSILKLTPHTSLFILMVISLLLFTAPGVGFYWGWICLSLLITMFTLFVENKFRVTPLFISLCVYISLMLINIFFINPVFHTEGLYFISFLLFSYLTGRFTNNYNASNFYKLTLLIFSVLAIWGIFQYLTGTGYIVDMGNRANAVFHTPNTFAAAINLILLPIIIYRLNKSNENKCDFYILLLFSALLVSQSRGGWIAFSGGLTFGIVILLITKQADWNKANIKLLAKLFILIAIFFTYNHITENQPSTSQPSTSKAKSDTTTTETIELGQFSSVDHRFVFYEIAWNRFLEEPILGKGYFNYKYFLDKDMKPEYREKGTTHFVHNDYLQHLMETGLIGFFALLLIIISFLYQAWRNFNKNKILIIAITSAAATFFIHALGDFVFYPPVLLTIFGLYLGFFDQVTSSKRSEAFTNIIPSEYKYIKHIKFTLLFILISYYSLPIISNQMTKIAMKQSQAGNYIKALSSYELARKLAPYNANTFLNEAKLWLLALKTAPSKETAAITDEILLKGISVNPYEKENLLKRTILHRDFHYLLNQPDDINTILAKQEQAIEWQPLDLYTKLEYIKTLYKAGQREKAIEFYKELTEKITNNSNFKSLLSRALNPDK